MDPMQVIEELGVPGRLPVEAIRAAQADREAMVPVFLRTIDDFLELRGPVDPDRCSSFFICSASGAKNRHTGRWQFSCGCRAMSSIPSSAIPSPRRPIA